MRCENTTQTPIDTPHHNSLKEPCYADAVFGIKLLVKSYYFPAFHRLFILNIRFGIVPHNGNNNCVQVKSLLLLYHQYGLPDLFGISNNRSIVVRRSE